jgi:hypothetical protein
MDRDGMRYIMRESWREGNQRNKIKIDEKKRRRSNLLALRSQLRLSSEEEVLGHLEAPKRAYDPRQEPHLHYPPVGR